MGDHWDYRAMAPARLQEDPEPELNDLVHRMAQGSYDYDVLSYDVVSRSTYVSSSGYGSFYHDDWCSFSCGRPYYGYSPFHVSIGFFYGGPTGGTTTTRTTTRTPRSITRSSTTRTTTARPIIPDMCYPGRYYGYGNPYHGYGNPYYHGGYGYGGGYYGGGRTPHIGSAAPMARAARAERTASRQVTGTDATMCASR